MGQLSEYDRTMFVHSPHQLAQPREDTVVMDAHLPPGVLASSLNVEVTGDDGADPTGSETRVQVEE
jgi:hypothetical protein